MNAGPVQIRRYPNRRFYHPGFRRYVTLGEIDALVNSGATVEVVDSRNGDDLTRQVLTQIVLERHPERMEFFPSPLLHGLIRASDLALDFWRLSLAPVFQLLDPPGVTQNSAKPQAADPTESDSVVPLTASNLSGRLDSLEGRMGRLEASASTDRERKPSVK